MNTKRALLAATLALVAGLGLTGCSVGFTPEGGVTKAPAQNTDAAGDSTAPDDSASDTSTSDESASADAGATTVGESIAAVRESMKPLANSVSCPGGTLDISSVAAVVSVDGPCENLTVSGTSAVVFAGDVGNLTVSAVGAVVSVETAKAVIITADATGLTVGWRSGTPVVTNDGTASFVGPEKN